MFLPPDTYVSHRKGAASLSPAVDHLLADASNESSTTTQSKSNGPDAVRIDSSRSSRICNESGRSHVHTKTDADTHTPLLFGDWTPQHSGCEPKL